MVQRTTLATSGAKTMCHDRNDGDDYDEEDDDENDVNFFDDHDYQIQHDRRMGRSFGNTETQSATSNEHRCLVGWPVAHCPPFEQCADLIPHFNAAVRRSVVNCRPFAQCAFLSCTMCHCLKQSLKM